MIRKMLLATAALASVALAAPANAQVTEVDGPTSEVIRHNYVTYHTHVKGTTWTYIELRDGSEWLATPCAEEDSANCWWNAKVRGNGLGTSFVNIHGNYHYVR